MCNSVESSSSPLFWKDSSCDLPKNQTKFLVAIAAIMFLGLVLSYSLAAPWLVPVGFFLLTLAPLFPLWKVGACEENRFNEKT